MKCSECESFIGCSDFYGVDQNEAVCLVLLKNVIKDLMFQSHKTENQRLFIDLHKDILNEINQE